MTPEIACTECGRFYLHTHQHFPKTNGGRLSRRCRTCTYAYNLQWKRDNPEKIKAYYERHKLTLKAKRQADRHKTCKPKTLKRDALRAIGRRLCGGCGRIGDESAPEWGANLYRCLPCQSESAKKSYHKKKREARANTGG